MAHDTGYQDLLKRIGELEDDLRAQQKIEQTLRRQNVYKTALHETTLGLIKRLDVNAVLEAIINHTADLVGTEHAFMYLYDSQEEALKLRIGQGIYHDRIGYVVEHNAGVAGKVYHADRSMIVNNYPDWNGRHPDAIWNPVQAVAALPLKTGDLKIGVIGALYTEKGRTFEDDILDLLNPFAELASIALENARLHRSLQTELADRKKTEAVLQEKEATIRSILQAAPLGIGMIDNFRDRMIVWTNQKFADMLGYKPGELKGRHASNLYPDREEYERVGRLKHAEMRKKGVGTLESRMQRKNGRIVDVLISSAPISPDKPLAPVVFTAMDITDRKKVQSQMQQVQRMEAIGTLAGGIAHDFNNLMMGIQGNTSLARLDTDPGHPAYKKLGNIELQIKKATELTRQLLGLARGGKYEVAPCDLNDIINGCVAMFSRTKKEIIIHKAFEPEPWSVEVDRGQIDQVLLNILVNAWQAMPGGGQLYIETANVMLDEAFTGPHHIPPGRYVKATLSDTGIGMDKHTLKRVFDPFFTTKEKERGTGLGLASAYGIIKNHAGIITAESEPGRGASFTIYLPASEAKIKPVQRTGTRIDGGAETVLLVDDEKIIVEVGSTMLKRMGYTVLAAGNGREAISILKEYPGRVDLVILDMVMPGLSGSATFDSIKEVDPDLKVLLATGYSLNGQAEDIMRRGCNGFIQKPFNLEQLSLKLREILG